VAEYEWDPAKAKANFEKHQVHFADVVGVFEDDDAITITDTSTTEERFKTLGLDFMGRLVVVAYTYRGETLRLICAESYDSSTRELQPEAPMKRTDDFSAGKRGRVVSVPRGKSRITIRLDDEILDWFREQVNAAGGGNYQTMMNTALREHIANKTIPLEKTLRRVIREELRKRGAA
jgi:uncharacterized DUF497 family protein/predicted DNA binding CopG/RHH family protein